MEVLENLRVLMWIVAASTTLVTTGLGLILGYHWKKYSGSPYVAKLSIFTYAGVSLVILLAMFGSIPA